MKRVLVLFIVGVVFFWVCSVQNATAQDSNIAQRIIGTWIIEDDDDVMVFNVNGTLLKYRDWWDDEEINDPGRTHRYGITGTQLTIILNPRGSLQTADGSGMLTYNISMSPDGETLILTGRVATGPNRGKSFVEIWKRKP